jgi:MFS family permease
VIPFRARVRATAGGLSPIFWMLVVGTFVNRLASFVVTFLALYLVQGRGFSPSAAGRVVALYGFGMLVAGPLGGTLADAVGRRATMLLSFGLGALSVGAIGFARDPALLGGLAFLSALTSEMYRPAMQASMADVVPPVDRVRAWAIIYWVVNLGWTFGLALGGLIASRSFTALFLADAATTLVFAAIVARGVPETRPAGTRAHSPLAGLAHVVADGPFVVFLLLNLTSLVVFVQFQLAAPVDMSSHGLGPGWFAALLSLNGFGVVVFQPLLGASLGRRDGARLLAASALFIGSGFGVYALAGWLPALPVYAAGVVLWTLGEVTGFPTAGAIVANLAPLELRGRYQGMFHMSWGAAFTVAPVLGGEMITHLGSRALWGTCFAICAAVAAGHVLTAGPRRRRLAELGAAQAVPPAAVTGGEPG